MRTDTPAPSRCGKKTVLGEPNIDALEALRAVYSQPTAYAAACKAQGIPVVGYFCDSLPIEVIEAAGLLAHRITGFPAPSPDALDKMLFALLPKGFWQVRQSSLEFLNHAFGRIVDGTYSMLDILVIPNTRKPLLNMYGQLRAAEAAFPEVRLPHLIVLDRAATRVESARAFNRASVEEFRTDLETVIGRQIDDAAIGAAIELRRNTSALLRELVSWRHQTPPGISGTDMLAVMGAAMFMRRAEYNALVRDVLGRGPQPKASAEGLRVFVGGSPPDNAQLYQLVESLGATIVAEDHCWGDRQADFGAEVSDDAMTLLSRRWDCAAACGFRLPFKATTDNIVQRARAASADAVILNVFRHDEIQIWDTPGQVAALRAAGIPVLHLAEQPHVLGATESLRTRMEEFLGTVRVRRVAS